MGGGFETNPADWRCEFVAAATCVYPRITERGYFPLAVSSQAQTDGKDNRNNPLDGNRNPKGSRHLRKRLKTRQNANQAQTK